MENDVTWRMVYAMFFLGCNFMTGLLRALKPLKTFKKIPAV